MLRISLCVVLLAAVTRAVEEIVPHGPIIAENKELDQKTSARDGKFFPVVQIVTFENGPCDRADGGAGVCYSQAECETLGGDASGTCAKGFGVCCSLLKTTGTITKNATYFVAPGHPGSYSQPGMKMVVIDPPAGTCQIRLDFEVFSIAGPVEGDCSNDTFVVSGANPGVEYPVLCGENGGQHIYIDVDNAAGPIKLITTTSALNYARSWKILVTFIDENDPCKAPNRCLQYHKETEGDIMSFNYGAGTDPQMLNNLNYQICFAYVADYCDIGLNMDRFDFGNIDGDCTDDYIGINYGKFCGDYAEWSITANCTGPISLGVVSDDSNDGQEEGFSGSYSMMGV